MPFGTKSSPSTNPLRPVSGLAIPLLVCAGLLTVGCREHSASGSEAAARTAARYAAAAPQAVTGGSSNGCDQGLFAATAWECLRNGLIPAGQERQP